MRKILLISLSIVTVVGLFIMLSTQSKPSKSKPYLLVSNFALYDSAKALSPKDFEVKLLIPFGQDMHAFVPSPKDLMLIEQSSAFFYVVPGINGSIKKFLQDRKEYYIDLTQSVSWIQEEEHHEHEDHIDESNIDPHYWLSIRNQKQTAQDMAAALKVRFSEFSISIDTALQSYEQQLDILDRHYTMALNQCANETIAVTHDAFSYLAQSYAFQTITLHGLSPESQTSALRMKKIMQSIREQGLSTIFYEVFVSNKAALAIANELHIALQELHTLANVSQSEINEGATYVTLMEKNLKKLVEARQCH